MMASAAGVIRRKSFITAITQKNNFVAFRPF